MTISFRKKHFVEIPPVTVKSAQLEQVPSFRLLGVNITDNLSWQEHTTYICNKASTRIYFLKRLRHSGLNCDELIKYYITFIRPILEYAAQAWHCGLTQGQSLEIEMIQKRAMRIIFPDTDYDTAIAIAKIDQLKDRREQLCRKMFSQICQKDHKLNYLIPQTRAVEYGLRRPKKYHTEKTSLKRTDKSFVNYCLIHYSDQSYILHCHF